MFPGIDVSPLRRLKQLYNNLRELDKLYHDEEGIINTWEESLTFFESLIKAYLDKNPR